MRRYNHQSPLDETLTTGDGSQDVFINTIMEQKNILNKKPCQCFSEKHRIG